jgi:hypothetical protein
MPCSHAPRGNTVPERSSFAAGLATDAERRRQWVPARSVGTRSMKSLQAAELLPVFYAAGRWA